MWAMKFTFLNFFFFFFFFFFKDWSISKEYSLKKLGPGVFNFPEQYTDDYHLWILNPWRPTPTVC